MKSQSAALMGILSALGTHTTNPFMQLAWGTVADKRSARARRRKGYTPDEFDLEMMAKAEAKRQRRAERNLRNLARGAFTGRVSAS